MKLRSRGVADHPRIMIPTLWTSAYGRRGNALTRFVAKLAVRVGEFVRELSRHDRDTFMSL